MGVFSGGISYTKFFVRGEQPKRIHEPFLKNIRLRTFRELSADEDVDERVGWCAPSAVFDLELNHEKVFLDSYLVLGVRTDRWRIPKPLFKAHFQEAEIAHLARTGREKLSKKDKEELTFRVTKRLRKKVLPTMRQVDVCWNLTNNVLWFWGKSARQKEDFGELFEKTFSLRLDEASPYVVASELLSKKRISAFAKLESTPLVEPAPESLARPVSHGLVGLSQAAQGEE